MLRRLGSNAYFLELPLETQFSPNFNIEDLTSYHGHDPPFYGSTITTNLPKTHKPCDDIEVILDDQVMLTSCGGYRKFLVKWKDRALSDCCWLQTEEVQCLNPNILELY